MAESESVTKSAFEGVMNMRRSLVSVPLGAWPSGAQWGDEPDDEVVCWPAGGGGVDDVAAD